MNVKIFNLISRTNEVRYIEQNENCKCKCECGKGMCYKGFNWNPSNCECEYDKSFDVGEYLDYKNCTCRKRLVDKLVEECRENIDEKNYIQIKWFIIQV